MAQGPDIFLSYKSEQHGWADRLHADLVRYGYDVFVDHDTAAGLRAGDEWEARLAEKIRNAEYFMVLWSRRIGIGSYVLKEINIRVQSGRPVTLLRLDDSDSVQYRNLVVHEFREMVELHEQTENAADVGFFEWNRAVRHLVEQLLVEGSGRVVEIPVVIIAMTRGQAEEIANGTNVVSGVRDGAFARLMDLLQQTAPFDAQRYGERPEDWRPFEPALDPTDPSVEQVISDFDRDQRRWHREHRIHRDTRSQPHVFLPYGTALREESTRQQARQRLQERPALIVIDPVSLVHEQVHAEVMSNALHALEKAFVIGLGPRIASAMPPVHRYFDSVERALFSNLNMEIPHDKSISRFHPLLSTCVLNVTRRSELSRWVQVASENILSWATRSQQRMQPGYEEHLWTGPTRLPSMYPGGER